MNRCARLFLFAVAMGALAGESRATVLTFDQSRDAATQSIVVPTSAGARVQQDYGDRVTGSSMDVPGGQFTYGNEGEGFTLNVVVDYFTGSDVRLWTTQYGDLNNVVFARAPLAGAPDPDMLNIRLTADPGFMAELYHFDLAGWANADYVINSVSVFSDAATLFSQSDVAVEGNFVGPRHSSFDFISPLSAAELLIQIDFSNLAGGMQDNIGIDNIRFGQFPRPSVIPMPGGLWLLGLGLSVLIGRSRRCVTCRR